MYPKSRLCLNTPPFPPIPLRAVYVLVVLLSNSQCMYSMKGQSCRYHAVQLGASVWRRYLTLKHYRALLIALRALGHEFKPILISRLKPLESHLKEPCENHHILYIPVNRRPQGLHLMSNTFSGLEYETGELAFLMDATVSASVLWHGFKTYPFTFGINNYYIKVADAVGYDRSLCNCTQMMQGKRPAISASAVTQDDHGAHEQGGDGGVLSPGV